MGWDDPKDTKKISYKQLHDEVSKTANGLKKLGIKKGYQKFLIPSNFKKYKQIKKLKF